MIGSIAQRITAKMVELKIVDSADEDCYIYGLELLLAKSVVIATIFVISIIIDAVIPSLLFTFLYILLRQYTGGFHCQTAEKCILLSILIYVIFAIISKTDILYKHFVVTISILVVSYIVILIFSPLADANKEIDEDEVIKYRKISIYIGSAMLFVTIISYITGARSIFTSVYFSLIADAILLLIAIIKKRRKRICS